MPAKMSYSSTRVSALLLDTTPSMQWNNLSACSRTGYLAFAHREATIVAGSALEAQTSSTDHPARSWRLPPPPPVGAATLQPPPPGGAATVSQAAWLALQQGGALLAVATHGALSLYAGSAVGGSSGSARAAWTLALTDLDECRAGGARAPAEAHFFRGLAAVPDHNLLLVGTSWGDVLVWHVERKEGGALWVNACGALRGAHSVAITSIAADNECVGAAPPHMCGASA